MFRASSDFLALSRHFVPHLVTQSVGRSSVGTVLPRHLLGMGLTNRYLFIPYVLFPLPSPAVLVQLLAACLCCAHIPRLIISSYSL